MLLLGLYFQTRITRQSVFVFSFLWFLSSVIFQSYVTSCQYFDARNGNLHGIFFCKECIKM